MNSSEKPMDSDDDDRDNPADLSAMAYDCRHKLSKTLTGLAARRDALVHARAAARKCLWKAVGDLRRLNASDETSGHALKEESNLSTTAAKSIVELQAALEQARKNYHVLDIMAQEVIHEWWAVWLDMSEWHYLALASNLEEICAETLGLRQAIVQVRAATQFKPLGKRYAPALPKDVWPRERYIGETTGKWTGRIERELRDLDQSDDNKQGEPL